MSKEQLEADAEDRFLPLLQERNGQFYAVFAENVVTNALTPPRIPTLGKRR
jgi:hypothetical protein